MRSMTGFGEGTASLGAGQVRVEVRALNHRHQELRLRLPPHLQDLAFPLEQFARARLGRGRYDISVREEGQHHDAQRFDLERLKGLFLALRALEETLVSTPSLSIGHLLAVPGLLGTHTSDDGTAQAALEKALELAIRDLSTMREREGQALRAELKARVTQIQKLSAELQAKAPTVSLEQRERTKKRLEALLEGSGIELHRERLEQELAILADKSDFTEELVRLESHIAQTLAFLDASEPTGRKLDFLMQEMAREANTIGAKAQHASLSTLVIDLKAEIEKLREQVQNVE